MSDTYCQHCWHRLVNRLQKLRDKMDEEIHPATQGLLAGRVMAINNRMDRSKGQKPGDVCGMCDAVFDQRLGWRRPTAVEAMGHSICAT